MAHPPGNNAGRVLVVNAGSSSTKFAAFTAGDAPQEVLRGKLERLDSASAVLDELEARGATTQLAGIGHRLVHGGPDRVASELVTPELLRDLKQLQPLDPTHLPAELELIAACAERFPGVPQVACFDTAFHRDLPAVARTLPVPRRYQAQGIRRYGFHGISYEYLMEELARVAGADAAHGRIVFAHLGSGASLAAVHNGKCVDTTMGFTPTGGLVMGTRTGDLDPGVLLHLSRAENLSADQLDKLVNRESGLLGISETSADTRELLACEATDPRAAEAIAVFCYQTRKWIGAMAAALGGLDTLVFSGGIGENAPEIRARICESLAFLGVSLVPARNTASAPVISPDGSSATVRVIRTNEEAMIARTVVRLLAR
ncbi:acetate/propionate family kinase [Gemmata sp. G18]|uniref:Acetate kinase n=1 Tax=Gemmata palustris TaxID=2822762 RepID=A0ABS5C2T7_9BACT|nr:acetate/propionate family kinase [Gemmata palustris]MBP3960291.1 acetate/propionate family kinase [Gemmata palustris]